MLGAKSQQDPLGKNYSILPAWDWVNPEYLFDLPFAADKIKQITIDPFHRMADLDRNNNQWPPYPKTNKLVFQILTTYSLSLNPSIMRIFLLFLIAFLSNHSAWAQPLSDKILEGFNFRNVGPAGMSGRITAIDVVLKEPDHIYIGSASGGVWESKNGGTEWTPIFDDQPSLSIGAIKINQQNPSEIWVGTGEGNPRNSQNSGKGIFRTLDGGKTWTNMGLVETKVIHRILIDPYNPAIIYAGAQGSSLGSQSRAWCIQIHR
jgi:photosystem II stability/assembly factor-like uncharacterized protein